MIEHSERYRAEYESLKQELKDFLDARPDIPEDIANKIKRLYEETSSDTTTLKEELFVTHSGATWSQELVPILLSLEGNEAFSVLQIKHKEKKG